MSDAPFKPKNFVQETLQQTAANWATSGDLVLQSYQWAYETDTQKVKQGDGVSTWDELPYWASQGQLDTLPTGSPASTDLIAYNAQAAAVAATASFTCADKGTTGATLIVGGKLYVVVASGATGDQINAGNDGDEFAANIAAKVTTDTATTRCTADDDTNDVAFTANTAGAAGNDIQLESNDNIIDDLVAFHGGVDEVNDLQATTVSSLGLGTPGVKRYIATVTLGDPPTPIVVLENSVGGTLVWTKDGGGQYLGTLTSAFPADKVWCSAQPNSNVDPTGGIASIGIGRSSANAVLMATFDKAGSPIDGAGTVIQVQILVYP